MTGATVVVKDSCNGAQPLKASDLAPVELLVVQPTPFCNLDCDYCYLPNRSSTERMPLSVLEAAICRVLESGLTSDGFTVVWHAGEPMVPGVDYYRQAFDLIGRIVPSGLKIRQSIQTNATLIDDAWCKLFTKYDVNVGVSVDGPAFIHDLHRKSRTGKGSHAEVQRGMDKLRAHGIDYHTISVLTGDSVDHPQEIFQYFVDNGVRRCGFNMEEIENVHQSSSLTQPGSKELVKSFLARVYELIESSGFNMHVRELKGALATIMRWNSSGAEPLDYSQEQLPFRILNVDTSGNFSSYSPELMGAQYPAIGKFVFGNVAHDTLLGVVENQLFQDVHSSISSGIDKCRANCSYFQLCGGGSPSNKYFENGSFDSSETLFCRLHRQAPIEVVLEKMEASLGISQSSM